MMIVDYRQRISTLFVGMVCLHNPTEEKEVLFEYMYQKYPLYRKKDKNPIIIGTANCTDPSE